MDQWHNKSGKFYGMGQGKEGTHHWWVQRLSSIALIPLSIWFVASFFHLMEMDYATISDWFDRPLNQTFLVLWVGAALWHAWLGIQVVVDDYVHKPEMHYFLLITIKLLLSFLGVISIVYILGV